MAEKIDDILKKEVESYNALNKEKSELENKLGGINKEMLKIKYYKLKKLQMQIYLI